MSALLPSVKGVDESPLLDLTVLNHHDMAGVVPGSVDGFETPDLDFGSVIT